MATIQIEIDVQNPDQIVKKHKGKMAGLLAVLFMSESKLKEKVEGVICEEMVKVLQENISKGFEDQGVKATLNIKVLGKEPEIKDGNL